MLVESVLPGWAGHDGSCKITEEKSIIYLADDNMDVFLPMGFQLATSSFNEVADENSIPLLKDYSSNDDRSFSSASLDSCQSDSWPFSGIPSTGQSIFPQSLIHNQR
jgi:hypothetical protein